MIQSVLTEQQFSQVSSETPKITSYNCKLHQIIAYIIISSSVTKTVYKIQVSNKTNNCMAHN